eukprot:CAMPEP_0198728542 /NCGR_PEP_ID=MMETSP1475-20131203/9922_1 /TAXON_ID= ORGANISM="Unidentified sp., Strain CCMP1999" /NCGR_SAMPLE_ID=MMETSP1475 /ASSEMBLY_ACC=CAM_ASM_001111 /LENGTH=45 /DNA_ID= /DNA_START= /DNA_END= /DNA_ORIENTATION=
MSARPHVNTRSLHSSLCKTSHEASPETIWKLTAPAVQPSLARAWT